MKPRNRESKRLKTVILTAMEMGHHDQPIGDADVRQGNIDSACRQAVNTGKREND